HGKVKAPPPSSRVPSWIHRVLLRGLQPRQENRYASMDALLADLERDPARARRRRSLLAAVAVAALAAGFGTALFLSQPKAPVAARDARPTLAVLPFRQIGTGGPNVLGVGMAEAIARRLSQTRGLLVRPIGSVMKFAAVQTDPVAAGRELRVDSVLDGTIVRA